MIDARVKRSAASGQSADVLRVAEGRQLHAAAVAAADNVGVLACAGITLTDPMGSWTAAASHEVVRRLDGLQHMLREGPCVAAMSAGHLVTCDDLEADCPWSEFAPRAVHNGVHSVLSVPFDDRGRTAVLNLYGMRRGGFGAEAPDLATALAAEVAVIVAAVRRAEHLTVALDFRDLIGQAKGIIMERHKVDADHAFALLSRLSQERNVKLHDVAREVVRTGEVG